jgi:hypothetical protein
MNNPLTEQDIIRPPEGALREYLKDIKLVPIEKVQSAKRLLKQKLCYKNDFLNVVCKPGYQCKRCEIIDACFQIDDGDDKE